MSLGIVVSSSFAVAFSIILIIKFMELSSHTRSARQKIGSYADLNACVDAQT